MVDTVPPHAPVVHSDGAEHRRQLATAINRLAALTQSIEDTAANIADSAAAINTMGKYQGKQVWDTTNNRMMRASGANATDAWYVVDGSTSVTPS